MDKGRIKCIVSGLSRYELNYLEKRFIEAAKHSLEEQSGLTEQQESMLESLYMEKTKWIRKGIINLAKNSAQNAA
jgi:predicted DNA-binding protein (MmcQ/YjbR family)